MLIIVVNNNIINDNEFRILLNVTFYMHISAISRVSLYGFENDTIKLYDHEKTVRGREVILKIEPLKPFLHICW